MGLPFAFTTKIWAREGQVKRGSALMSCLVGDPSFNRTSPFVLIKFIISLEGASSIVQWGSHSLLCALKSPRSIIFSLIFPKMSKYSRSDT